MAGEKLTQQTAKTSGFSLEDLIHIVDVSLNPPGTSFKAKIGDVLGALSVFSLTVTEFQALVTGATIKSSIWYQVTNAVGNTRTLLIVYGSISVDGVIAYDVRSGEIGRWNWSTDTWISISPTPYKRYEAIIDQSTDPLSEPVVTVKFNNTGEVFTWAYDSEGTIVCSKETDFDPLKTTYYMGHSANSEWNIGVSITSSIIELTQRNGSDGYNAQNGYYNCPIEIRIYP
jgi:hypothetical protein